MCVRKNILLSSHKEIIGVKFSSFSTVEKVSFHSRMYQQNFYSVNNIRAQDCVSNDQFHVTGSNVTVGYCYIQDLGGKGWVF